MSHPGNGVPGPEPMRALFYVPPAELNRRGLAVDRVYGCNYGYDYKPPIHFLQLATWMRERAGWEVELVDCPAEGLDLAGFDARVDAARWDVACAWSVYLSAEEDLAAMRRIRARQPWVKAVYAATAATWKPEEFVGDPDTFCLLGEPEQTCLELDGAWRGDRSVETIDGLAWWDGRGARRGGFRQLLDVTELPVPDRRLLRGTYRANRLDRYPITVAVFSRGCGFRCTFCTPNGIDQTIELEFKRLQPVYKDRPPLRKRTVEQIVAEFEELHRQGYRGVEIADNILTWGNKRTQAICAGIEPLGMQWICLARANMLHDAATVRAMSRAGCKMVYMGSESFDDGLLEDVAKELKVRDVVRAVEVCKENGVEPEVSVLMGASPNETWRTLLHSYRAARRLGTRFVHFSVALPSPSTELYDQARENGWFLQGDFYPVDNTREVIVNLPHLSARELRLALKLAYALQYLSPTGIAKQARHLGGLEDLRHKARSGMKLLGFLAGGDRPHAQAVPAGRVTAPA